MAEAEFHRQEEQRLKIEEKKHALQNGTPTIGSLKEFMVNIEAELTANEILKQFIEKAYVEVDEAITRFSLIPVEQNLNVDMVHSELTRLHSKLSELNDNFNVYASKMLDSQERRLALVQRAVLVLEAELTH